ncbi:phytoene desaturase family protein [Rubritalea tangerina]|uniref:Phytoene desaturase family protein n=1 Tax=Rubritalea tangerina TaxID=430798 RepID=A0ABW4Z8G5_9BACT
MHSKKKVLVIGAGPGGLTSAMLLSHRGFDVTIVEKADRVGGRNAELKVGPYSFDTGPTFLHQKFTLDEMFAEVGRKTEDYLDIVQLDPMTKLTWSDTSLETSSDLETMCQNIEASFRGQSDGFRRFMDDHGKKMNAVFPCLQKPYHKLKAYFTPEMARVLKYVATTKNVVDVLKEYFDDERLMLAFTFQAKYLGMSPWHCPGLFSILSYLEYKYGIFHVQGGLCKISDAMAKVVEEEGGKILLNTAVKEVLFEDSQAKGVLLENGETMMADDVIVNADYAQSMVKIMNGHGASEADMRKKKFSCSTFMLYLGLDTIYKEEPHHHILFADSYRNNVEDITGEKTVSEDMSVYVRNSSVVDPHVAPEGHSQLYILVPTINTRHGFDWSKHGEEYRNKVLDKIERQTGMKDLRQHIVAERWITPDDWASQDIFLGATFNLAHTMDQMLYFRPPNKLREFDNVYLVGGGTHPGSGLPTIYESGRMSCNLLCDSRGVDYDMVQFTPDFTV